MERFLFGGVALLAVGGLFLTAGSPVALRPAAEIAAVPLFDDAGGQAMFTGQMLTPGIPVSRCITVTAAESGTVTLAATDLTGLLVDDLTVTVDRGSGGSFGDCAAFTGGQIFSGTLRSLANGVATGWNPALERESAFRITVELPAGAPPAAGKNAGADFVWRLELPDPAPATAGPGAPTGGPMPTTPAPRPTSAPPSVPAPAPSSAAPPAPTLAPSATPSSAPSKTPTLAPTRKPTAAPTTKPTRAPISLPVPDPVPPADGPDPGAPDAPGGPDTGSSSPGDPESPGSDSPGSGGPGSGGPGSDTPGSDTSGGTPPVPSAPGPSAGAGPGPAPGPSPSGVPAAVPGKPGGSGSEEDRGAVAEVVAEVAETVALVAAEARKHPTVPVALVAVLALFLVLQNRADHRDPKLALAPVWSSRWIWIPRPEEDDL